VREWNSYVEQHPNQDIAPIILDVKSRNHIEDAAAAVQRYTWTHNMTFAGLINNCGKAFHMPLEFHDIEDVRDLFETNLIGPLSLTQKLLPLLRRDHGRIVFTSSLAGQITQPKEGIYAATKHGVESVGDALRQELAPYFVSVSLVEPGFVRTPIISKILDSEAMGNKSAAAKVYDRLYTDIFFSNFEYGIDHSGRTSQVARKVLAALRDTRPKTRYHTTNFMRLPTWMVVRIKQIVPDRLLDKALV
jgi:short-subunit dehydrogenase